MSETRRRLATEPLWLLTWLLCDSMFVTHHQVCWMQCTWCACVLYIQGATVACCVTKFARVADTWTMNRRTALTLRVVIVTSLIWFLFDVFLLMYFTDCTNNREVHASECNTMNTKIPIMSPGLKSTPAPTAGPVAKFFDRIIPEGRILCVHYT